MWCARWNGSFRCSGKGRKKPQFKTRWELEPDRPDRKRRRSKTPTTKYNTFLSVFLAHDLRHVKSFCGNFYRYTKFFSLRFRLHKSAIAVAKRKGFFVCVSYNKLMNVTERMIHAHCKKKKWMRRKHESNVNTKEQGRR